MARDGVKNGKEYYLVEIIDAANYQRVTYAVTEDVYDDLPGVGETVTLGGPLIQQARWNGSVWDPQVKYARRESTAAGETPKRPSRDSAAAA